MTLGSNSKANDRQVGGDHYKTGGLELWDLFGPEALMFYAVRYVARWRKKDGVRDLEKGKHVVEKLRELNAARRPMLPVDRVLVEAWAKEQGCNWVETTIILRIMFWESKTDIDEAVRGIEYLLQTATKPVVPGVPKFSTSGPVGQPPVAPPDGFAKGGFVHTQTMPPNKTVAEAMVEMRRVPRYDTNVKHSNEEVLRHHYGDGEEPVVLEKLSEGEYSFDSAVTWHKGDVATALAECHNATAPWVVNESNMPRIESDLFNRFYTKRGENWVLDPHVTSTNIPNQLRAYYTVRGDGNWTLDMKRVPSEVRDYFPSLLASLNMTEWEELYEWQRVLYTWNESRCKYELSDMTTSWHVEEPVQ